MDQRMNGRLEMNGWIEDKLANPPCEWIQDKWANPRYEWTQSKRPGEVIDRGYDSYAALARVWKQNWRMQGIGDLTTKDSFGISLAYARTVGLRYKVIGYNGNSI